MRYLTLVVVVFLMSSMTISAQKYAYVDTEYILGKIPAYKSAQKELESFASELDKQIERKYQEIDKMYQDYQAEEILFTPEMKKRRQDDIVNKEKALKDFQREKFGVDGEMFKKRAELVQPIQDEIYKAIKQIAAASSYAMVFDKTGGANNLLYAQPKYNISNKVLKKMGYEVPE